jgi:hypothetical protein
MAEDTRKTILLPMAMAIGMPNRLPISLVAVSICPRAMFGSGSSHKECGIRDQCGHVNIAVAFCLILCPVEAEKATETRDEGKTQG